MIITEILISPTDCRQRACLLRSEAAGVPWHHTDRIDRLHRAATRFDSLARRLEWDRDRQRAHGEAA
ncbi:hypothetical protein GCM10007301_15160 [Azorhizobium oxalatiphilum]|uniref:Uncharacterized protein n=1 Tax=Azorhizobium oxalatiphilum TaxID=980631 RepID=A0A917BRZ2_9HYPH|nr:hypothetical protein [Azorhizobium oxalatiphilum]GGF56469.1 hypothetical protein GCM10007301_15160 [Azorhizobium oxalatiphilum]